MNASAEARLKKLLSEVPPFWHALYQEGFWEGHEEAGRDIACNLIRLTSYDDQVIADLVELDIEQVHKLREELKH